MRIYVAAPLTRGSYWRNVERAQRVGCLLMDAGHFPFIPHLFAYLALHDYAHDYDYEHWMRQDFAWLDACDAVLRLSGKSPGGDREVQRAIEQGKPVYYSVQEILDDAGRSATVFRGGLHDDPVGEPAAQASVGGASAATP